MKTEQDATGMFGNRHWLNMHLMLTRGPVAGAWATLRMRRQNLPRPGPPGWSWWVKHRRMCELAVSSPLFFSLSTPPGVVFFVHYPLIVVSTCTTQNSCLFVLFHDNGGKLMEWAILEHSWLHQQSWLTSTAEAQELMISSAPRGIFPTLFRGQVPAHRIDLLLRRRRLPPFGLAGHLCLWALGVVRCMPGTVRDSCLNFKPFMFLHFIISLSFDLFRRPVWSSHGPF